MWEGWVKSSSPLTEAMPMDMITSLILSIEGGQLASRNQWLTVFWSNCVHGSWCVTLGNGADDTYWIQVAVFQQIWFSMKYGRRSIFFFMNVDLALMIFWLPHNCTSQVVPWHYPWHVSEFEASPWCRTPLAMVIVTLAASTKVALLAHELVDWIQKLGWQYQRDDFFSWNTVVIFL